MSFSQDKTNTITLLLQEAQQGDQDAWEKLYRLLKPELARLARSNLANKSPGYTLQATDLVHEALQKVVPDLKLTLESRRLFFALANRVMEQCVIGHERKRHADKRGGGVRPAPLQDVPEPAEKAVKADGLGLKDAVRAALNSADTRLDDVQRNIVELRCFAGHSHEQIAETLGVSRRTVIRRWNEAKKILRADLAANEGRHG